MPTKEQRVQELERAQLAPKLIVCNCAKRNGCVNMDGHFPNCPALKAREEDYVIVIRYEEESEKAPPDRPGPVRM